MFERPATPTQACFVDMPFGKKIESHSGVEIDFDQIYEQAIEPAIREAGLNCIRGDREQTGGIIHEAMFARLLLCEFVIADLTTANANVFYELGVRHAARPYTTIPIFATVGGLPFDVTMVRAIPYELEDGALTSESAEKLRSDIRGRIRRALEGPVAKDSPLFQLFERFPGIEISHELTDAFKDRIQISDEFQAKLDIALQSEPGEEALGRLTALEAELGDLRTVDNAVLMKLFLAYRDLSAWDEIVQMYDRFPAALQQSAIARQQLALALNRRAAPGDRDRAIRTLEALLQDHGDSAETYGILGRVYKDRYKEAKSAGKVTASAYLDNAIQAYRRGFECEPADYYPGVNAINLLIQKSTEESQREAEHLAPLVSFAVARRGGATSDDYWDLATVLELAVVGRDYDAAEAVLPKVLITAGAAWMAETTADNLQMILERRGDEADSERLKGTIAALRERAAELPSGC